MQKAPALEGNTMSDAHKFLNALLDGLREEAQVKRPEKRMNREGSSNSDKENVQQGAVEPSTNAGLVPSEEDICDKETKRTYVEDMFEHELETTRVCMICARLCMILHFCARLCRVLHNLYTITRT